MENDKLKVVMRPLDTIKYLENLCSDIRNVIGDEPTIVEVGSYMGESSMVFSKQFPKGTIICIDSWVGGFDDKDSASHANYLDVENQFNLRMSMVNNIKKLKGYSTDFKIDCDVVYIDACHKYECVINDINHWKPLVKKVISGHDFYNDEEFLKIHPHVAGVKKAVIELLGTPDNVYGDGSWIKYV